MNSEFRKPEYFFNREISWLRFNERVLEEAERTTHPLLERLKFLTIFHSNLDEFFMIRVAGLKEQINARLLERTPDGLLPQEQLQRISASLQPLMIRQAKVLMDDIVPELRKENIRLRTFTNLRENQREWLREYFIEKIFPVLTPLAIDPAHPFPQLRGLSINLLVELKESNRRSESKIAVVQVPGVLPRFINLPGKTKEFFLLEDIIEEFIEQLFPNLKIVNLSTFRITRNADLDIAEAEADDLLKLIERELRKRRLGTIVRLEINEMTTERNRQLLKKFFGLEDSDIYRTKGYLDVSSFRQLLDLVQDSELRDEPFTPAVHPQIAAYENIFDAIRNKDILFHHPYDSFFPVVELLQEAARDPQVLAIKQTLYRTGGKSAITQALREAANNGKQVTALFELKARFDEENNITWAKELERVGVNVIYGLMGLKTHCKMLLIIRQEKDGLVHYVHLSSGNYNEKTAQLYTDIGFMTCDKSIGQDVSELFNVLTGYSKQETWRRILVAPINMRQGFESLIQKTIQYHSPENPSSIKIQLNSLVDPEMIEALYRASCHGIKIELIIRGICCLVPGIPSVSENITVRSIVGRFLEHARICIFEYNGEQHIYCSSADWMPRNLNRRVEVAFPILDPVLKQQIIEIMDYMLNDNTFARILQPDGSYQKVEVPLNKKPFAAQTRFLQAAILRQKTIDTTMAVSG